MNQSRIEQTIEQIYTFIEECKASKLYPNKVVVAKDELYDLLDALRLCAPEEIKRYQKIINNRDAILNEAHQKAEEAIMNAKAQNAQLLDQNELVQAAAEHADRIVREADERAEQMIHEANADAEKIRGASLQYTNDLLTKAEQVIN
ncbi:MAG: ATPase, partial [Lachnoclostridium sp.]|nr:ATPase [Lachnoclostridium sp.]